MATEPTYGDVKNNALGCIGATPLVRLNRIPAGVLKCNLLAKCEFFNAGGSVKDRIGKQMVLDAAASGRIQKGDILIEPTSGNTGIGMALAAAVEGYRMIITMPDKMSLEKEVTLTALGAEVIRTPTEAAFDSPDSHIGQAKRLHAELPNSHILDQYGNPSNPGAHYAYTGEEIWTQTAGNVDMVVISAGTGGTISGIAKKLKEKNPNIKIVGVDPVGSILAGPGPITGYQVEGIGYDFIPDVLDRSLVDEWIRTEDTESFTMARRLIHEEGLLCGGSSGTAVVAALKAAQSLKEGQTCVVILPDSVRNYMSKFLYDNWMISNNHLPAPVNDLYGSKTVADLPLPRPIGLTRDHTCQDAVDLYRKHSLTVLPIVDKAGKVCGRLPQSEVLHHVASRGGSFSTPVGKIMLRTYHVDKTSAPLAKLHHVVKHNPVAFIVDDNNVLQNVVTADDLLDYVSNHLSNTQ